MSASSSWFDIYATSGTANVLNRHMVATNAIRNVDEPSPNIIDLIESGKIDYVVATSVKGRHPELGRYTSAVPR